MKIINLMLCLSLVFYQGSAFSYNRSSKSVSGVTIDISSMYFKKNASSSYVYGYLYYLGWYTCYSDKNNYKVISLVKNSPLTINDYKYYSSSAGSDIYCDNSRLVKNRVGHYDYFGCALIQRSNNKYITSSQTKIEFKSRNIIDISSLIVYAYSEYGYILGDVKYKKWNHCLVEYKDLYLVCIIKSSYIYTSDFATSASTKYVVKCNENTINVNSSISIDSFYYGCALINDDGAIFDYTTDRRDDIWDSSVYIDSVNIIHENTYVNVSATVYIQYFPCSSSDFKLVCLMSVSYPTNLDFLNLNNEVFDYSCYRISISLITNNTDAKIFSCAVIDKSRTFVYIYDTYDPFFKPAIDLEDIERKADRNQSKSHIVGIIRHKNWKNCGHDSRKYRLRCIASYNNITEYDIYSKYIINPAIKCDGNKVDTKITGKGKKVYFGCGIYNHNGDNIIYNIKKLEIKIDFIFLLKMVGFTVGVNFGAVCIVACCKCYCN